MSFGSSMRYGDFYGYGNAENGLIDGGPPPSTPAVVAKPSLPPTSQATVWLLVAIATALALKYWPKGK